MKSFKAYSTFFGIFIYEKEGCKFMHGIFNRLGQIINNSLLGPLILYYISENKKVDTSSHFKIMGVLKTYNVYRMSYILVLL